MPYNKIVIGNEPILDLSIDSVTSTAQVLSGVTFHKRDGSTATGTGEFNALDEYSIGGSISDGTATGYHKKSDVTTLCDCCFYGCSSLVDTQFTSGITSIGQRCFYGCTNISQIDCSSADTIGANCFYGCDGLNNLIVKNGVTYTPGLLLNRVATINGNMYWQEGTTSNKIYLSSPSSLTPTTLIGVLSSSSLSIVYNDGTYNITFARTYGSTNFTITWATEGAEGTEKSSGGNIIDGSATSYTIKSGTTSIAQVCFRGCSGLTSITLPSTVTTLNAGCFYGCTSLPSIDCSYVTTMGADVFTECNRLQNIIVKNGVQIGASGSINRIATINGNMYWQEGTTSNKIYLTTATTTQPKTLIGTLTQSAISFTYNDGTYNITFTRVDSNNNFTITWTTSNEGDENNG